MPVECHTDMFIYESNTDLTTVASLIQDAKRILVTTHAKPDGDAIGSTMALKRAMPDKVEVVLMGPVSSAMRSVAGTTPWHDASQGMPAGGEDLILVVDTGAFSQVELMADWIRDRSDHVVVIDHHASGNEMGARRYVDSTAASCTILIKELLHEMGVVINGGTSSVAEALYCGLATDTGWFRHSNADARAFRVAAELLEIGLNRDGLYRTIEETAAPSRLALQARAMQSIEYVLDGRGAIMSLRPEDFKETGGTQGELPGVVNVPLQISTVEFAVLMCCEDGQETKLSFRSKPPFTPGSPFVNVSDLANKLGGGGHVHASGARVMGSIENARVILDEAVSQLETGS